MTALVLHEGPPASLRTVEDLERWRAAHVEAHRGLAGLRALLRDDADLAACFEREVLPFLVEQAARRVEPLPLLLQGQARRLVVPRTVALSLVCNLLLGTVEQPTAQPFPRCDASYLLAAEQPQVQAKLRCILEYVRRAAAELPEGEMNIERCVLAPPRSADAWAVDESPLGPLRVEREGTIEEAIGCLQADFANRFLGGGALRSGCVQEEIRFAITPELLAAMPLCAVMRDDEAIRIDGVEQFSRYAGYGGGLRFAGGFVDPAPRAGGAPTTCVVAIDALERVPFAGQLEPAALLREVNKAYVGFAGSGRARVATGNWGCGVFLGHPQLKAMLQWLAASAAGIEVTYFAFAEARLGDLQGFVDKRRGQRVGDLWRAIVAATPRMAAGDGTDLYGTL
jgi:poly(ADP-ribose) glycohydrolase